MATEYELLQRFHVSDQEANTNPVTLPPSFAAVSNVLDYRLDRSSGHAALREEIMGMIARTQPLPKKPLPLPCRAAK